MNTHEMEWLVVNEEHKGGGTWNTVHSFWMDDKFETGLARGHVAPFCVSFRQSLEKSMETKSFEVS